MFCRKHIQVSGFHPLRQGDASDRGSECPSEWVLLQFSSHRHRGIVHLGDEVCFAREMRGERRKDRFAVLALEPNLDSSDMDPVIRRDVTLGEVTDACRWTIVHADGEISGKPVQCEMPLLLRGKYNDCLAVGRSLWGTTVSPVRRSGKSLVCKGRDARMPDLRFRIVRAGIPFSAEPVQPSVPSASPPPPLIGPEAEAELFGSKSLEEQEQLLLDDLLFCLQGFEGTFIRKSLNSAEPLFEVDVPPGADASTAQFVQQLLPLCNHHAFVQIFMSQHSSYEYGTVNHALCAALRDLLREFASKVAHWETSFRAGELSLAGLWYQSQASMDTFALLHRVTAHVSGQLGGAVLNGIEEVMTKTSLTAAQELCEHLLQQASRPYFDMVSMWVYEGQLQDPYCEFFVSESHRARDERTGGPAADFWQKHFTLDERAVPQFLASSRERILHAGKYLHIYFSAAPGRPLPEPAGGRAPFRYSRRRRDYAEAIDVAYRRAAAALLDLFMKPQPDGLDLLGRLKSLRHFFFLSKADWFGHFLDTAGELERPAEEIPLARLDSLLDLAVRASSMATDPYREDISCGLHSFRVEDACHRMVKGSAEDAEKEDASASGVSSTAPSGGVGSEGSGVRCLTLKYRTAWPLSILFSRTILLKYQVIFRHLLYCRYVERKLVEVWVDHQCTKELGLDSSFSPYYSLRQRMLHFCRDYIYYATVEVLEPKSHEFLTTLRQAETIDDVLHCHDRFLEACLREVVLTERDLYRHLSKVLQTCLTFAHNLRRFSHSIGVEPLEEPLDGKTPAERRLAKARHSTQRYLSLLSQRHYSKMMAKWKTIFESQLQAFLRQIQQESKARYEHFLSNLATRLDYNDYYSSVLTGQPDMPPS
ncbi:TUBGCP2 [Symbiodinium pilosum]|uniref:Spindle pole body component n=1 Tax=Symbiodinium pilosum TaxID=2952 RepID=A0A812VQE0_SYMPI|nr:TUBGCP2 [Symbiodinium pilosum]